jgi:MATE family multidrug resistance protein
MPKRPTGKESPSNSKVAKALHSHHLPGPATDSSKMDPNQGEFNHHNEESNCTLLGAEENESEEQDWATTQGARLSPWKLGLDEAKIQVSLALPCMFSSMLNMANRMLITLMVGHLGANQLAASTLAYMLSNVLGFSICFGLASALDTLASQAVTGASDVRRVGIYLQRSLVINFLLAIPIVGIW